MVKIKICGLSRPCDIEAVNEAKPDFIGFVFAESRRKVTFAQAETLRRHLAPGIIPIGVFVNEPKENILALLRCGVVSTVQLHGCEDEAYIYDLKTMTDALIIKAVPVIKDGDSRKWRGSRADFLLLDNKSGGTGESFDWDLIGEPGKPFFLAGGLNEANLRDAVERIHPYAIDISGGVETNGYKDPEKIRMVVELARRTGSMIPIAKEI